MQNDSRLQALLAQIRHDYCQDNSTELARRISKDASYVHRLFYPREKKGAKGIGLEIMNACTEAFKLPPGYWDGFGSMQGTISMDQQAPYLIQAPAVDEWTAAALAIMKSLDAVQKAQMVAKMREYKQFLGPPRDGQALQVAG